MIIVESCIHLFLSLSVSLSLPLSLSLTPSLPPFLPLPLKQGSVEHCMVGVQILHQLVLEMNQAESMRSLAKHRKVASSFRDESLFNIFTLSCTLMRQINVRDETQVHIVHVQPVGSDSAAALCSELWPSAGYSVHVHVHVYT